MGYNKFYAIKVGNGVKDIIVNSWEECKKYVYYYNSVYKSFTSIKGAKNYLKSLTDEDVKRQLDMQYRFWLKKKIHNLNFIAGFDIPLEIAIKMVENKNIDEIITLINSYKEEGIIGKKRERKLINFIHSNEFKYCA